jgi:hypothetical protein
VTLSRQQGDSTIQLLHAMFPEQIAAGRLLIYRQERFGPESHDTAAARNVGLSALRSHGIEHFFTVDADDIYMSNRAVQVRGCLTPNTQRFSCNS